MPGSPRAAGTTTFLLLSVVYALSNHPWVASGDSGQFQTMAATGGIAHAGYPTFVLALQAIGRLPWSTFVTLNFVAAGLWSCTVILAGYAFGQVSEKMMSDASSGLGLVMLVLFLGVSWIVSKKLERVAERAT